MEEPIRFLIIDNHTGAANIIEEMLVEAEDSGQLPGLRVDLEQVTDHSQGIARLEQSAFDAILACLTAPTELDSLAELRHKTPRLPVVACTSPENEPLALLAMSQGATDYLLAKRGDPRTTALVVRHIKECARLSARQSRLDWLEENMNEAIWRADPDFRILEITPSFTAMTGASIDEATGTVLKNWIAPDSQSAFEDGLKALNVLIHAKTDTWLPTIEFEHLRKDHTTFWCEISLKASLDPNGQISGWTGVTRDISLRHSIQEKLDYLSMHDPQTGLFNRAYCLEELKRLEFSRLYPITILLAHLEGLNKFEYQYNIFSGDELVKHAATLLRTGFRSEDMVARASSDEFIVLMPRCSSRTAEKALQRVINMVEAFNDEHPELPLSLSLGIATAELGQSLTGTLKLAHSQRLTNYAAR
jgi:diguanylate cyclase (GGDEF)-like protein/PAS domain S-box-containing protein